MSHTPNFDAKIKTILDAFTPGERVCALTGQKWMMTQEEIDWYRKFNVPSCAWHPQVQMKFLNGFNTGMAVFWKKDVHDQPIFSAVHPDSPIRVMKDEEWIVCGMEEYGREIDPGKPVVDQLWDLMTSVPINATRNVDTQNSVAVGSVKAIDCYLVNVNLSKRCFYGYALIGGEDCVDVVNSEAVTQSFTLAGSRQIHDSFYLFECRNISASAFLFDCWNCEFCFGATNKRNKKFLWFNEQLSETEWRKRRAGVDLSRASVFEEHKTRFYELWKNKGVWPPSFSYGNDDSEGERIVDCARCHENYWQGKSVDCFRCRYGISNNSCMYGSGQGWETGSYMCTGGMYGGNKFSVSCSRCHNMEYSAFCIECENCFGCFGMKHAKFHIFNKPYEEAEYWKKLDALKCRMMEEGSYGLFFPAKFSPSGFQFSVGELYTGYSQEELERFGALRFDAEQGQALAPGRQRPSTPLAASEIPDALEDIDPSRFVGMPISDEQIGRKFSVTKAEFEMYLQKRWPFPRRHFVSRLTELIRHSNSPIEESATCVTCAKSIATYKNFVFPERRVYCRQCYLRFLEEHT